MKNNLFGYRVLLIMIVNLLSCGNHSQSTSSQDTIGQLDSLTTDTTLLFTQIVRNDNGNNDSISIYIDKYKQSDNYLLLQQQISNYLSGKNISFINNITYNNLKKKYPKPLPIHTLDSLKTAWIPLCSYKGTYYINELEAYPIIINDSLFMETGIDEPCVSIITSAKEITPEHFQLQLARESSSQTYDLYLIDNKRQIMIFAWKSFEGEQRYRLYTNKAGIPLFDMIVWNCNFEPNGNEIKFDDIDYKQLLAK